MTQFSCSFYRCTIARSECRRCVRHRRLQGMLTILICCRTVSPDFWWGNTWYAAPADHPWSIRQSFLYHTAIPVDQLVSQVGLTSVKSVIAPISSYSISLILLRDVTDPCFAVSRAWKALMTMSRDLHCSLLSLVPWAPPRASAECWKILPDYRMYLFPKFMDDERCDHIVKIASDKLGPSSLAYRLNDDPSNSR